MKVVVTILALISFSSAFAADPGCSDTTVKDKEGKSGTARTCTSEESCKKDQGESAAYNKESKVCAPNLVTSTNCPQGVEGNRTNGAVVNGEAPGTPAGNGEHK